MTFDYQKILVMNKTTHCWYIKDLVNTNIILANSGYNIGWFHPEHTEIAGRAVRWESKQTTCANTSWSLLCKFSCLRYKLIHELWINKVNKFDSYNLPNKINYLWCVFSGWCVMAVEFTRWIIAIYFSG